jgi:hypothetical protein
MMFIGIDGYRKERVLGPLFRGTERYGPPSIEINGVSRQ